MLKMLLFALTLTLLRNPVSVSAMVPTTAPLRIGVLAEHDSSAWAPEKGCIGLINDHRKRIECNLEVYASAVETASKSGVQMLVMPEGYGLGASTKPWGFFEPFNISTSIGKVPCALMNATLNPQIKALSCSAKAHSVALVFNVFTRDSGGKRITEIVVDEHGAIVTAYFKHHPFPIFEGAITAGPFDPTVFDLLGHRFGIVVCYEGLYPFLTGDFSQMDKLVAMNASSFVWSVGGAMPMEVVGAALAKRWDIPWIASEDSGAARSGLLLQGGGADLPGIARAPIKPVDGYIGNATILHTVVELPLLS